MNSPANPFTFTVDTNLCLPSAAPTPEPLRRPPTPDMTATAPSAELRIRLPDVGAPATAPASKAVHRPSGLNPPHAGMGRRPAVAVAELLREPEVESAKTAWPRFEWSVSARKLQVLREPRVVLSAAAVLFIGLTILLVVSRQGPPRSNDQAHDAAAPPWRASAVAPQMDVAVEPRATPPSPSVTHDAAPGETPVGRYYPAGEPSAAMHRAPGAHSHARMNQASRLGEGAAERRPPSEAPSAGANAGARLENREEVTGGVAQLEGRIRY